MIPSGGVWSYSNMGAFNSDASLHRLSALNRRSFVPIFLPAGSFDRIGVSVSTGAVSTWRLGLHTSDPFTFWPIATPMADYGTIDMSGSAGFRTISMSLTIPTAGWHWVQIQVEAYTATPTMVVVNGLSNAPVVPLGFPTDRVSSTRGYASMWDDGGTGGSLGDAPTSWASLNLTITGVRVWIWKS